MSLEPIGLVTLLVGGLCVALGPRFSTFALFISILLGAAAAALLHAMGGANVPPAHLLLGFVALVLLLRPKLFRHGIGSLAPFCPGFWFLLTLAYGVPASIILPRLFAGATYVFAIGQSDAGVATILQIPLAPVSGNITQPIYLIGNLVCFVVAYAFASRPGGLRTFARAGIACALANMSFVALDLGTYFTGTTEAMALLRNASYRMLTDVEIGGFKRIVGSFAEAASFAYITLGLLAFTGCLWLQQLYPRSAGLAALGCFSALVFATSTSGYIGLAALLLLVYALCLLTLRAGAASRHVVAFLAGAPLLLAIVLAAIALHEPTRHVVQAMVETTLLNKLDSDSGIERASWNREALVVFWDTMGFGAGIGSVRASSFLIAVPASIGVLGAVTYGLFVLSVVLGTNRFQGADDRAVQTAARTGCAALIAASAVAGGSVDLGLLFSILAGVACSKPLANERAAGPDQLSLNLPAIEQLIRLHAARRDGRAPA